MTTLRIVTAAIVLASALAVAEAASPFTHAIYWDSGSIDCWQAGAYNNWYGWLNTLEWKTWWPPGSPYAQGFLRSGEPWWNDTNHEGSGGVGLVQIVAARYIDGRNYDNNQPGCQSVPVLDLRDGSVSVTLRGRGATLGAAHLVFWIQAYDAPTGRWVNLAYTGQPLDEALQGPDWTTVTLALSPDPALWTCLGATPERTAIYGCAPIDRVLGRVDENFGFLLLPVDRANPPTGVIDFDAFVLTGLSLP